MSGHAVTSREANLVDDSDMQRRKLVAPARSARHVESLVCSFARNPTSIYIRAAAEQIAGRACHINHVRGRTQETQMDKDTDTNMDTNTYTQRHTIGQEPRTWPFCHLLRRG